MQPVAELPRGNGRGFASRKEECYYSSQPAKAGEGRAFRMFRSLAITTTMALVLGLMNPATSSAQGAGPLRICALEGETCNFSDLPGSQYIFFGANGKYTILTAKG